MTQPWEHAKLLISEQVRYSWESVPHVAHTSGEGDQALCTHTAHGGRAGAPGDGHERDGGCNGEVPRAPRGAACHDRIPTPVACQGQRNVTGKSVPSVPSAGRHHRLPYGLSVPALRAADTVVLMRWVSGYLPASALLRSLPADAAQRAVQAQPEPAQPLRQPAALLRRLLLPQGHVHARQQQGRNHQPALLVSGVKRRETAKGMCDKS